MFKLSILETSGHTINYESKNEPSITAGPTVTIIELDNRTMLLNNSIFAMIQLTSTNREQPIEDFLGSQGESEEEQENDTTS